MLLIENYYYELLPFIAFPIIQLEYGNKILVVENLRGQFLLQLFAHKMIIIEKSK